MLRPIGRSLPFLVTVFLLISCGTTRTTTDIQVAKMKAAKASFGKCFTYMVDNAILRDMSVADIHFVSHTSELNGIGAARLERMATLLNTYGGIVRYETTLGDESLISERLSHMREFLDAAGCDLERVQFALMPPGGRGLPGREAVAKYQQSESSSNNASPAGGILSVTGNQ